MSGKKMSRQSNVRKMSCQGNIMSGICVQEIELEPFRIVHNHLFQQGNELRKLGGCDWSRNSTQFR